MSAKTDYIPKKDSELVVWSANFTAGVAANAVAWEIPPAEVTSLQSIQDLFATLHSIADSPARSSISVAEKNDVRNRLIAQIRELAGFRLKNPVITDVQRIALGLHVHDTTHTTIPAPKTRPKFGVEVLDFRRLKVSFQDQDSNSKAKPYGINGAVIIYAVLDTPPADHSALTHSVLATRTPHILEFSEEERGKTVYIAICWQNEKGEKGPWSEVESAIVP